MKKLTLGFSTVFKNYDGLYKLIRELKSHIVNDGLSQFVDILVVVQFADHEKSFSEEGSQVIFTTESGLSKSRNRVIEHCESEYFWILDDDVSPTVQDIKKILTSIEDKPTDICIGQIRCSDRVGDYKDYFKSRSGKLGLLRVSSIEIIVKKEFVKSQRIVFNERLGLGTPNPTGEENCFLLDAYHAGATFKFINDPIISHPCFDEARIVRTQKNLSGIMVAKGYIAREVSGISGFLLMLYWQVKFFAHYKRLTVLTSIPKGYFFRGGL